MPLALSFFSRTSRAVTRRVFLALVACWLLIVARAGHDTGGALRWDNTAQRWVVMNAYNETGLPLLTS